MKLEKCPVKIDRKDFKRSNALKSFLGTNYDPSADGAEMVLVGLTEKNTPQRRSGAVSVPEYLRKGDFWRSATSDTTMDIRVDNELKIIDVGDIITDSAEGFEPLKDFIRRAVLKKVLSVFVGGSEKRYLSAMAQAYAGEGKIALVRFSAHPIERSSLPVSVDSDHSIEIGLRGTTDIAPWNRIKGVMAGECFQENAETFVQTIKETVKDYPVFLVYDADFLDPSYAPCTENPSAGGLSVQDMLIDCDGIFPFVNVKGMAVFNTAPEFDPGENGLNDMVTSFWKLVMCEAKELILEKPEPDR